MSFRAAAALSEHPVAAHAVGEVVGNILESDLGSIDLLVVFVEASHTGALEDIASSLQDLLAPKHLIGATACGVLGQGTEVEDRAALSVWAASGVSAQPFRIESGRTAPVEGWDSLEGEHALMLADPFSSPQNEVISQLALDRPGLRLHGGLASGARGPGGNRLLLDDRIFSDGAVGCSLWGPSLLSAVSQGCRPIGPALVVTASEGNLITGLASQPPMERLRAIAAGLSEEDRALLGTGVHIGLVIDENRHEFHRGDFLIRSLLGADAETGAIAIGAEVSVGATVQFHVRDADTASEDLREAMAGIDAAAALTFTCNGRGERLFGRPGHDAELVHQLTGSDASGGMFCAGEIGPVTGANHLHGFTAASLIFLRE